MAVGSGGATSQPDDGARHGLRGDVDRARQRRPQLQPRHRGRVAGHGQGAPDRALRHAALHDRHRLLGRLARPAAGRQRLPGHLPGDPAAVLVPRRVVDGPAARRLPPRPRLLRGPDQVGAGRRCGPRRRSRRSRATPTTCNAIVFDTVYWTSLADPSDGCPGVAAAERLQRPDQPRRRPLHARRLHDQRRSARARRACGRRPSRRSGMGSPACRSATSASSSGSLRSRRATSRPAQFVDLNSKIGGADIDLNPIPERSDADPAGAAQRLPQRRRQRDQQPDRHRDHRPARSGPGRVPRRLPLLGDPRPARAARRATCRATR